MGFFNNMFLGSKSKFHNETVPAPSGGEPIPSPSSPAPSSQAAGSVEASENPHNVVLGDWLEISSLAFSNKNRYPPIVMPNGKVIPVRTNGEHFRINEGFTIDMSAPEGPLDDKYFWFRLSGTHLYYTMTKDDMNLMGAIAVDEILDAKSTHDASRFCFKVQDQENTPYTICAANDTIRKKWVCLIRSNLGLPTPNCDITQLLVKTLNISVPTTEIEQKIIQPIILIPLPSKKCNENWNYNSYGQDWNCECSEGREQSPIDLPTTDKAISSPIQPLFQYEEVEAKSPITTLDGQIKSNQYIKIKYFSGALRIFHPNLGKIVTLDGSVYVAEEIVFHTPSEHTLNGKRYEMEMQIIHYGQSAGDIAKQVILSFLFEKKAGVYNKFMDDVDFFDLPNQANPERDITNNLYIPKIFYSSDDNDIPVMKPFSFYTYQGSITFPPCTERTIHYVASEPIPLASAPIELMKEALRMPDMIDDKGNAYLNNDKNENYRLTQPLNDRPVFYYDSEKYCGKKPAPLEAEVKHQGHYEKVPIKVTEYYFVAGHQPSGLPGSFVVDENEAKNLHTSKNDE
jgi:carbonic anhydrase